MRKVLDGLRFDTEKADAVGEADNLGQVSSVTDFGYWKATLYRTPRSGRFFLAGSGGPASRFGQSAGLNTWCAGSDLIPLSEIDARDWSERYLDPETVERFFAVTDA